MLKNKKLSRLLSLVAAFSVLFTAFAGINVFAETSADEVTYDEVDFGSTYVFASWDTPVVASTISAANVKVSASDAYKLIGNAVPPLLGFHIAKRIETLWDVYFGGVDNDRS